MKKTRRRLSPTPMVLSALTLAAVLNTAGCFGGDDAEPASPTTSPSAPSTSGPPADDERPGSVELGTVSGHLTPAESKKAVSEIGDVVLGWFDDAYLAGDYPREDFGNAFGVFTADAASQARSDAALTSNAPVGAQIDTVTTDGRRVRLDLLAAGHQVVGATARIELRFTTAGAFAKTVTVKGKLFLTPGKEGRWRIFGYDIARGEK